MGTRGAIGFRIDGKDKLTYNHSDSYPDALGSSFMEQIRELVKDAKLAEKVRALEELPEDYKPTAEDVERCAPYSDFSVSTRSKEDWYCLTRNAQGDLDALLVIGKSDFANEFILDSLFCEFAYIINLDDQTAEFYVGFNKDSTAAGRYASKQAGREGGRANEYYGARLARTWKLDDLPSVEEAVSQMNAEAERD